MIGAAAAVMVLLLLLLTNRGRLRKYNQFLAAIIVFVFNLSRLCLNPIDFETSDKGKLFLRGYYFACMDILLVSRFTEAKLKLVCVLLSLIMRLCIVNYLDYGSVSFSGASFQIIIALYAIYIYYFNEKKEREIFQSFYEYREDLTKFKDLIANYIPQGITVLDCDSQKPLFSNKVFLDSFKHNEEEAISPGSPSNIGLVGGENEGPMPQLEFLRIERDSLREVGKTELYQGFSSNFFSVKELILELMNRETSGPKALSLSASFTAGKIRKLFEIILKKMRWDNQETIVVILNDITYQEHLLSLKIADENKNQVIATVSHELRTPLNGIIGILDIAKNKSNQEEVIEYLDLCENNAQLLLGLVNSLLDLQQIKPR